MAGLPFAGAARGFPAGGEHGKTTATLKTVRRQRTGAHPRIGNDEGKLSNLRRALPTIGTSYPGEDAGAPAWN